MIKEKNPPKVHKKATNKQVELIKQIQQSCRYKVNAQKSVLFLHTGNEHPKKDIKKTIPFTTWLDFFLGTKYT